MTDDTVDTPMNAGLQMVGPLGQAELSDVVVPNVGPRRSEWLPNVLEELVPTTSRTVREIAGESEFPVFSENSVRSSFVREVLLEDVLVDGEIGIGSPDAGVALENYLHDLLRYALEFDGYDHQMEDWTPQRRAQRLADLETITTIGTGRGTFNAGVDVLEHGFCRVHRDASIAPTVLLLLDGDAWINVDDNRTIESALEAIELLGDVLDVRLVAAPRLINYLERHFDSFCDRVGGLTEDGDASSVPPPVSGDALEEDLTVEAWDRLGELDERGGRLRLLANLDPDGPREIRDLRQDDEIDLAAGSIDRYVGDLEALELVSVDDSGRYNSLMLTRLGEAALEFVTDDHAVRHPLQSQLDAPYRSPPSVCKYSVTGDLGMGDRDGSTDAHAGDSPATAEEWLSATGDPDDGAPWVQWIDSGPSKTLDAWAMHDRLCAGRRVEGVNLVDHEIPRLEDGRVAMLSSMEDHTQLVVQWGGSLPTLARLPATLLSDRAFSKILEPSAVGSAFSNLFKGMIEEDVENIIQRGMQVGWFSEDELQFENFRERWGHVRAALLERLGELVGTRDYELRQALFNDLHGLLASTTALYRAIGQELTIHVRVPDTQMLMADEGRLDDFLSFFRYTVPKQTAYGVHSGNRMLLEHRPDKLRRRLPVDVQADDPAMDLTAAWVVTGPQASLLQEDLEDAIGANADDVREAVQEGNEIAPAMEIPVVVANEFGAIKSEVSRHLERKGFRRRRDDVVSLTRACMAILSTETRGASPYDVASALLHLKKKPGIPLTVAQLENALAMLPPDRLLRSEKVTVRKMFKALLEADEPMGRSELIDAAGISSNSYDRNWRDLLELETFGLVDRRDDKTWRARLIPFWTDLSDKSPPEDVADIGSSWTDVLFDAVFALNRDVDVDSLFKWPQDFDEILTALECQQWLPMFVYLDDDLYQNHPTAALGGPSKTALGGSSKIASAAVGGPSKTEFSASIATIGRRPPGADPDQLELVDDVVGDGITS